MFLQLLSLLLGCQLICGTPAPTHEHNLAEQSTTPQPSDFRVESATPQQDRFQPPDQVNVAQPVISISERVQVKGRDKKDLGTLGYVLGILMVVIIIAIGSGIVVGYMYKRGRDLKKKHEQEIEDRRLQRINLPLSAFSNPTCDIIDENTIEVSINHTPNAVQEGTVPLMDSAGTPGA
ncbi:phosphoinositide-3-kinase-interacting protein 1 [Bufo gargarizans]|uniref:phosphoinositide-3-kinase-interacting protein 1 n=1 Tax=Bufo gargarizans TaxID=30331 RepID=UPI001CF155C3|nr:phosphoinositide-3-kinase-interacting protein 1 [Bufo gargarizans]